MTDIAALQAQAKAAGYKLTQLKNGAYVGSAAGVEFEDDDFDRLDADMKAVVALAEDPDCVLLDESDEDGESIVEVVIDGKEVQFIDVSVAEAYAQAKAAKAEEAERRKAAAEPKGGRGRRRVTTTEDQAPEAVQAAPEPAVEAQAILPLPEPRESPAESVATIEPEDILPPAGGEPLNALKIDLRSFQAIVVELGDAVGKLHALISVALGDQPGENAVPEEPKRGRGRPRGNGR